MDERLVALHVDNGIVHPSFARADLVIGFAAAVRAAAMVGGGHFDPAAELQNRIADALVVGGDHGIVQHPDDLLIDAPDDRLAAQQGQRFAGKPRRSVAGGNDG